MHPVDPSGARPLLNPTKKEAFALNASSQTTPPLTEQQLVDIADRAADATTGPWESDGAEINQALPGAPGVWVGWIGETLNIDDPQSNANAAFVAHARQDVPALLRLVESMRAAVTGHDCPDPSMGPLETVVSAVLALSEAEARVAELETALATARTEAIADVGDWLDEVGEKNAAYLVYTVDIPAGRDMKRSTEAAGGAR